MGHPATAWAKGLGGDGRAAFGGAEVHSAGGFVESPDSDGRKEDDDGPEGDEDGGGPLGGEARPEMQKGVAVADADPDGDAVAQEAADGEGPHELFARHVRGARDEDEGRERHGRGKQSGERDGEDGVVLHPVGDASEDGFGDVFFEEGHAAGLTDSVREETAESGADGGEGDEEEDVGVGGGEDDEEDVGDAGDGEGDEGAVDRGDGQDADEAEMAEEVNEAAVGVLGLRGEGEDGGEGLEGERHAGEYDVSWNGVEAGIFFEGVGERQMPRQLQMRGSFAALQDDGEEQATAKATADPFGMTTKKAKLEGLCVT
jgi:hypothetical protein